MRMSCKKSTPNHLWRNYVWTIKWLCARVCDNMAQPLATEIYIAQLIHIRCFVASLRAEHTDNIKSHAIITEFSRN